MERTRKLNIRLDPSTRFALEIFSSGSYITINKKLLTCFGPEIAIYISNLIDKYKYFIKHEKSKNDWFYLIHNQQMEQTGLTITRIRTCKKVLKEKHILRTKMKGFPPKEYFQINFSALLDIIGVYHSSGNLRTIHQVSLGSFIRKPDECTLYINKENKYKEIENSFLKMFPDEWIKNKSFLSSIKDFIQYRSQKGNKLTEMACTRLANKLTKFDITIATEAINRSIENSWTGIFPESIKEKQEPDYEEPTELADKFRKK